MAERHRKPPSAESSGPRGGPVRQQIRIALPANDNPTPHSVLIRRALLALGGAAILAAGGYAWLG